MKLMKLYALVAVILLATAPTQTAHAIEPSLSPSFIQRMLAVSGTESEIIITGQQSEYSASLYIPDLKGSAVLVGFPAGGIKRGAAFQLEVNGKLATVTAARDRLVCIAGDRGVSATGVFGTLECIFSDLLTSLSDAFDALLSLDILGFLEAVVGGILGVVICIIF